MRNHLNCGPDELTGVEICGHGHGCSPVAKPEAARLLSDHDPVVQSGGTASFDQSCVDESPFVLLLQGVEGFDQRTTDSEASVDFVFQSQRLGVCLDAHPLLTMLSNPTSCVGCDSQRQNTDGNEDRLSSPAHVRVDASFRACVRSARPCYHASGASARVARRGEDPACPRMNVSAEGYFTRSKTRCDAIEPIMPSTVMVLPSALSVVLDVPVPPGPVTEPS